MTSTRVAIQVDHEEGAQRIIFAHGAGAGLQSDFMQYMALGLAVHNIEVVRFNFPYWQQFMDTGKRRLPDRQPVLQHAMQSVAAQFQDDKPLFLMGKSMGARVAFQCADKLGAKAAIGLGFPFHPVGKPDTLRLADLVNSRKQNLIIQGERDALGRCSEVADYPLPENLQINWLAHADHSFIPTKRSGIDSTTILQSAIEQVATFIQAHSTK